MKFRVKEWLDGNRILVAKIEVIKEEETRSDEVEALVRNGSVSSTSGRIAPYLPREAFITALNINKPSRLANFIVLISI
jgi:hypothetical protein